MQKTKKAMVSQLQVVAFGIIALVILVGIGLTITNKLGDSVAVCATGFTYELNGTSDVCANITDTTDTADPTNAGWVALDYGQTQLGSTGLLSWLPAIIALIIGVFFLAYFAGGRIGKYY